MSKKKFQVLFICIGNSARSQMAEGLMRKMAGDIADVYSAGVHPEKEVNSIAKMMMEKDGIDTSKHYPKGLDLYINKEFDVVVTTCEYARRNCPVFPGNAKKIQWDLEDPFNLEAFQKIYAEISKLVSELAEDLRRTDKTQIEKNKVKIEF